MIPYGGTFVRPGVIAWDGVLASPVPTLRPGYSSCEAVEQAITGVRGADSFDEADAAGVSLAADADPLADLAGELARARLWLPLPAGPGPVTDGSAIVLPVIRCAGTDFVPAFTSVQRLGIWADPRTMRSEPGSTTGPVRSGDPVWVRDLAAGGGMVRHVVVSFLGLACRLPSDHGIAVNPGTGVSVRVWPDAVALIADVTAES